MSTSVTTRHASWILTSHPEISSHSKDYRASFSMKTPISATHSTTNPFSKPTSRNNLEMKRSHWESPLQSKRRRALPRWVWEKIKCFQKNHSGQEAVKLRVIFAPLFATRIQSLSWKRRSMIALRTKHSLPRGKFLHLQILDYLQRYKSR